MSILPPNATAMELDVEAVVSRELPVDIAALWDPDTCPAAFLPWLADALSVDEWSADWTEARKREVIRQSIAVHRRKGTRSSLTRALDAAGYAGAVITEAQDLPRLGGPYAIPGGIVPQMLLDWREDRTFAATGPTGVPVPVAPGSLQAVVRAGAAGVWGPDRRFETAAADTARIDHTPATGGRRGLLLEMPATNLALRSADLSAAAWGGTANGTVLPNAAVGIDGGLTATLWTEDTATGQRGLAQAVTAASGTQYTVYAIARRVAGARHLALASESSTVFGPGNANATLNMDTGVVTQGAGTNRTAGAIALGGGWWLLWMSLQAIASGAPGLRVGLTDSPTNAFGSWTGDGVSAMAVAHVQIEAGFAPTSPIPTTTAAVTRNGDQPTISLTGQPWFNPAEGTLLVHIEGMPADANSRVLSGISGAAFDDSTIYPVKAVDNAINLGGPGGGSLQLLAPGGYTGQDVLLAWRYAAPGGAVSACLNGGPVLTDSATTIGAAFNRMRFGAGPWSAGGNQIGGRVRLAAYYGRQLTDGELQAVTTPGGDVVTDLVPSRARPLGRGWRLGLRGAHWADYTVEVQQQVRAPEVDLLVGLLGNTAPARCRLRRLSMALGVRHVLGRGVWQLGRQITLGGVFNFEVTNG